MTTIRATCPECGEVDLTPDDIRLTVIRGEGLPIGPDSHYTFRCPGCEQPVNKPADERIARLLTTGGVSVTVVEDRSDLPGHPESPIVGPGFTYDDLLDFHLLLAGDGWFELLNVAVPAV